MSYTTQMQLLNSNENDQILSRHDQDAEEIPQVTQEVLAHIADDGNRFNRTPKNLYPVSALPQTFQPVFKFEQFNPVQSMVIDSVLNKKEPIVLCAPTGSGKTVIFELGLVSLMIQNQLDGKDITQIKAVYVAPIKALCSERYEDWNVRFGALGIVCKELTGDTDADDFHSIKMANLILTTPEKWDSISRRWKDNKAIIKQIQLFMIDEVHMLNDSSRGATVEAVVSRMKMVKQSVHKNNHRCLRVIAVSATMTNVPDIAHWLGNRDQPAVQFVFDESYRPVKLDRVVMGYSAGGPNASDFKFDYNLNYKVPEIIHTYSNNRPTLVFVSTRKGSQQTANFLNSKSQLRLQIARDSRLRLQEAAAGLRDSNLKEMVRNGIGFHNAGLDFQDRKTIESLFLSGDLLVLCSTSTLAMGINLPAHLVIVKSTQHYTSKGYEEYTESEVLQMIGRAGRPQFDTSAVAVIMTKQQQKTKYELLVGGQQTIESSLHKNLIEHLNAEIVLGTIPQVSMALEWLKLTFLYVRIMKTPQTYGLTGYQTKGSVEDYLQQIVSKDIKLLESIDLIKVNADGIITPTESGRLMARHLISFNTMNAISKLTGQESQQELITFLSNCAEFTDVQLRVTEKRALNELNKCKDKVCIRYPIKGKIKTSSMKVSCLIQAHLGCLTIQEFSLTQDITRIIKVAGRITRCEYLTAMVTESQSLVELFMSSSQASCLHNAIILHKCLTSGLWEDSLFICKQLPGIGLKGANTFVNAGYHTFSKLQDLHPREVERLLGRHPPFGTGIIEAVTHLPKYEMALNQNTSSITNMRTEITVALRLANADLLQRKSTIKHHSVILLVSDADNNVVHRSKIFDSTLTQQGKIWSTKFVVERAVKDDKLSIALFSMTWVGLDIRSSFTPQYSGAAYSNLRNEARSQMEARRAAAMKNHRPTKKRIAHQPKTEKENLLCAPVDQSEPTQSNKTSFGQTPGTRAVPQGNMTRPGLMPLPLPTSYKKPVKHTLQRNLCQYGFQPKPVMPSAIRTEQLNSFLSQNRSLGQFGQLRQKYSSDPGYCENPEEKVRGMAFKEISQTTVSQAGNENALNEPRTRNRRATSASLMTTHTVQEELPNEKVDVDDGVSYSPLCSLASQNPYQDGSQYLEELEKMEIEMELERQMHYSPSTPAFPESSNIQLTRRSPIHVYPKRRPIANENTAIKTTKPHQQGDTVNCAEDANGFVGLESYRNSPIQQPPSKRVRFIQGGGFQERIKSNPSPLKPLSRNYVDPIPSTKISNPNSTTQSYQRTPFTKQGGSSYVNTSVHNRIPTEYTERTVEFDSHRTEVINSNARKSFKHAYSRQMDPSLTNSTMQSNQRTSFTKQDGSSSVTVSVQNQTPPEYGECSIRCDTRDSQVNNCARQSFRHTDPEEMDPCPSMASVIQFQPFENTSKPALCLHNLTTQKRFAVAPDKNRSHVKKRSLVQQHQSFLKKNSFIVKEQPQQSQMKHQEYHTQSEIAARPVFSRTLNASTSKSTALVQPRKATSVHSNAHKKKTESPFSLLDTVMRLKGCLK